MILLLQATTEATRHVFTAVSLDDAIEGALRIMGSALHVDAVSLHQLHEAEDCRTHDLRYDWRAPGSSLQKKGGQHIPIPSKWYDLLSSGKSVGGTVRNLSKSDAELLRHHGIASLLIVPVFSQAAYWGFMSFANFRHARSWTRGEEDVLTTLSASFGQAIELYGKDEELRTSEARYRNLVESLPDIIFITDYASRMLFANSALEIQTGFVAADFQMPQKDNKFIHPEDAARVADHIQKFVLSERTVSEVIENRFIDKWGFVHWYSSIISKVNYAGESALQFVTRDVTDRRLAAQTLLASEERYRAFVEQSSEGIYRVELERPIPVTLPVEEQVDIFFRHSVLAECNVVMAQMYGFSSVEEAVGTRLSKLLVPEDPHNVEYMAGFVRNNYRIVDEESHEVDTQGRPKYFLNNAIGIIEHGHCVRVWGTQRDITYRKQFENELANSRANLLAVLENTRDSIWAVDHNYRIVTINSVFRKAFLATFGVDLQPGTHVLEAVPEALKPTWKERYDRVLIGRESFVVNDHYDYGGTASDFEISFCPITTEDGAVTGATIFARDITERKRSEEALARSEKYFRSLIENALDIITILNEDGTIRYESPSVAKVLGYMPDELLGRSIFEFSHPGERRRLVEAFRAGSRRERKIVNEEFQFRHRDGSWRTLEVTGHNMLDDPAIRGIVVNSRDVSEKKRAEDALRESETRFRAVFDGAGIGIALTSLHEGMLIQTNPQFNKMLGYADSGLDGCSLRDITHPDDVDFYTQLYKDLSQGIRHSHQTEKRYRHREGHWVWGRLTTSLIRDRDGRPQFVVGMIEDITSNKQAEELLRQNEERYRLFSELASDYVYEAEVGEGTITTTWTAGAFQRVTGYQIDELAPLGGWSSVIHPDDRGRSVRHAKQLLAGRGGVYEYRIMTKSGEVRWLRDYVRPIKDAVTGRIIRLAGGVQDITEKKKAEEELAAEKERLSVTLNSIGDGVITTDVEGRVVLLNPVAEALTGWTQREAFGQPIRTVFSTLDEHTRQPLPSPVERVIESGSIVQLEHPTLFVTRDGAERHLADSGAPIRDRNQTIIGVVLVFRDVTEKQKLEDERIRASKLESLGILAGGIAHDFNNILTAIMGNISYVRSSVSLTEEIAKRLNESEKACIRARSLTQQLLTFSKGGAPVKSVFPITAIVRESCDFAVRGSNVLCEYDLRDDNANVEADSGQIAQVVQNVVLNGIQAMPEGGTIHVMTARLTIVNPGELPLSPGQYVLITIADEGVGIERHHLPKIFDPYFTTKERGTGLGLAVSYSIIQKHHGHIHAVSEVGAGTTFYIYIPLTDKRVEMPPIVAEPPAKAKGRILVLDDETSIGEITCELLAYFGYEADHVTDGVDAVKLYVDQFREGRPFDALIVDLTIPGGMGGKEAIRQILEVDPSAKAIVTSGYSNDPVISDYRKFGCVGYLIKPYETDDMIRLLHRITQGPGPTS